jgi:hypothetical protein
VFLFLVFLLAGTTPLPSGHNPATWMLEVTGGSMATLVGANKDVDWPSVYQSSALAAANAEKVEELSQQVGGEGSGRAGRRSVGLK